MCKKDTTKILGSDWAEKVINPHPLQILIRTLNTQFCQVLKTSVKSIQLKLKAISPDVGKDSSRVLLLQQGSGKQHIPDEQNQELRGTERAELLQST